MSRVVSWTERCSLEIKHSRLGVIAIEMENEILGLEKITKGKSVE